MRFQVMLLLILSIGGCVVTQKETEMLLEDSNKGIVLLKAKIAPKRESGLILIYNVETQNITRLEKAIEYGRRNKPYFIELEPGTYKLYQFQKYNNIRPSLKKFEFSFNVEKNAVNYVGDWLITEYWRDGQLGVYFSHSYNDETVNKARERFPNVFSSKALKISLNGKQKEGATLEN